MAYRTNGSAASGRGAQASRSSRSGQASAARRSSVSRTARSSQKSRSDGVFDRMAMRPIFGSTAPKLQPRYESDVRVIRPDRKPQVAQQPSMLPLLAKMAAIIIVLVAALSFARIMLTSGTVVNMIENESISSQISEARTTGTSLEMEQSVLKNPAAIRAQAKQLNMVAPTSATTIMLKPDIVAIESGTTLSLSGTIKNVVQIQE